MEACRDIRAVPMRQLPQTEQMVHLMQVQTLLTEAQIPQMEVGIIRMEVQTMEVMMMEVRMTEVMMMGVQMIRKITAMIL